jgi:hypothetical protein
MSRAKLFPWVRIIQIILFGLLLALLYWKFQVATIRFFDVDEFTHIHWAVQMMRGERPYIDFFTFFTPGFYWFLTPMLNIFGSSTTLFLASRVVGFFIFVGLLVSLGIIFGKTRGYRWALLPLVLLSFVPMPYDKFLEVRPDNLAMLLAAGGLLFQIIALSEDSRSRNWFLSGFLYALSLVVLVKMLPFAVVGIGIFLLDVVATKRIRWSFVLGFFLPLGFLLGWLLSLGDTKTVLYSLSRMPLETNTIGKYAIMEPHLFFFPNSSFYGGWGLTKGLLLNHTIWVIGLIMGVYRLFTPYITADGQRKKALVELLMAGMFILSVFGYVQFFPLKHSQYLIPIAFFVAYYCADGLILIARAIRSKMSVMMVILLLAVGSYCLYLATGEVNKPKLMLKNSVQMGELQQLEHIISPQEEVLDLDGRLIYRKNPYYICCLSMGLFVRFMSRPPEALYRVLEDRKVPYIYQGESGRLWELGGEDISYIQSHYESVGGWGDTLWKRKVNQ